ncbi:trehalose-phosphatase [Blastomonas sp.]|uniref:trehalose-phosphatase n=1 Tax=Blastomonas sp. TaxID=1909299 RepID=UPI00391DD4AD
MPDSPAQANIIDAPRPALQRTALLLDFDGTLVDIRSTPDAVEVSAELAEVMAHAAARLEGRLAIVSGRSLEQLEQLWSGAMPAIVVAGSHGQELKVAGTVFGPAQTDLFARLASVAGGHFSDVSGVVIEEKTFGLAIHYRLASQHRDSVQTWAQDIAAQCDLLVQHGDMVFELRPRGADKGDAVRAIMALDQFQGSVPVFIGDDYTDIPAFEAVQALGGTAISVGPRTADRSDQQLADVAGVLARIRELVA